MSASQEQKQRSSSTSTSSTSRKTTLAAIIIQIRETFGVNLISVALAVAAVWAVAALVGLTINTRGVLVLLGIGIVVSAIGKRTGAFSFSFAVTSIGVGAVVVEFLVPNTIVALFSPITSWLRTIPGVSTLFAMPALQTGVLAISLVTMVWILEIRIFSALTRVSGRPEAANADTVARALARRFENLANVYVAIAVAAFALTFTLISQLLGGGQEALGELGAVIANDPVGVGAVVNTIIGWVAAGGTIMQAQNVPLLGPALRELSNLSPAALGMFMGVILLGALAAREVAS